MRARTQIMLPLLLACTPPGPSRVDAPADSAAGEVAFELTGPGGAALVVPVTLNGQGPYQFVLDTGATMTCVERGVSSALALPEARGVIGTGTGIGGGGRMRMIRLDSIRIGQTSAHDLMACELDLQNLETAGLDVDGLLGLNVLKEFRVTLDFSRRILRLEAVE